MQLGRRELLGGLGGAVVGAAVVGSADRALAARTQSGPLPFYGSSVSLVRPDLGRPGAAGTTISWRGSTTERILALTFDDGPAPDWTPKVLDALERAEVPATFFLKGTNVRDHGRIHLDRDPRHELGNHTWDHQDLGRLEYHACAAEIRRCSEVMGQTYGAAPTLFRPPYGHVGGAALITAAEAGLHTVLWSAQFREWKHADRPDGIVEDVATSVHPGAIILGHDIGKAERLVALDRLGAIIARLKDDGYTFATVSDLLAHR